MSLSGAAAAMGLPEDLVQRSAAARAAETGATVDEILAAWAGGETVAATAPAPATEVETAEPEMAAQPEAPPVEEPRPITDADQAPVTRVATTRAPIPDEVTASEAAHLPEVVTVPTAGIKERTNFVIPRWLTTVILVVPLFALFALGGASTGECGQATELTTNIITGEIENCDGSPFTGQAVGGGGTDFIALGDAIYNGNAVAGVNCSGCHGPNGQGSGPFPALTGVLTTFGACADHIEWVTLGSGGFSAEGVYGDTNKTVNGNMPSFVGSLSPEQIAAVASFERVRFGGGDPETVLVDCGLVDAPVEGEGSDGAGDANTEGGGGGGLEDTTDASALHVG
ncbi:MAG: c-type cytochrome [Acidimicrobiia bacterium]